MGRLDISSEPGKSCADVLSDFKTHLDSALVTGNAGQLEDVIIAIYDFVDSDPHITWAAIEQSKLNKAVGEIHKSEVIGEELRRRTARLVKKLFEVSDTAKGGGDCLKANTQSMNKPSEIAVPRPKPVGSAVALGDIWHMLPTSKSCWQAAGDDLPMRVEVAESDPRYIRHVGAETSRPRVQGRVSVVVPTMSERYKFHGQIWLCYFSQTYHDKELIVVESGDQRSPFFSKAMEGNTANFKYVHLDAPLSAGEKRDIAIRDHSTGEIIANFDDDDIYFPAYLATMVKLLKESKSAMVHLKSWHVIDVETNFCAVFDREIPRPSLDEASRLSAHCGFSMVYTYAAWQCVPWPFWTSGEDVALLEGFVAVGLPVATRADIAKAMTVLHVQHGRNMHRSVCQLARTDVAAVTAMIARFENACRRLMKVNLQEYEEAGEALLYTYATSLNPELASPRGLYLATKNQIGDVSSADAYASWCASELGLHPNRKAMLARQREARNGDAECGRA